jgi:DNA-binding XRE family transcriptional regulator
MEENKRRQLELAGWKVGTVDEFLELSPEESELVEFKLALSRHLKKLRNNQHLSQEALAKRMSSSQSRVAKIESGDPSVSIDLLVRALVYTGANRKEIAEVLSSSVN